MKINEGKQLDSELALIEFYGFEKRKHYFNSTYLGYEWLKDGEKVESTSLYVSTDMKYTVWKIGDLEKARSAFYHSVQNLKRRGLIKGSVRYGLQLNEKANKKFYQSMT